jgi:hypothetical protein
MTRPRTAPRRRLRPAGPAAPRRRLPPTRSTSARLPAPAAAPHRPPAPIGAIVVTDVTGSSALDNERMFYRLSYADALQARTYANSRWTANPLQMMTQRLKTRIAQSGAKVLSDDRRLERRPDPAHRRRRLRHNFDSATRAKARSRCAPRCSAATRWSTRRPSAAARRHQRRRRRRRARTGRQHRRHRRRHRGLARHAAATADDRGRKTHGEARAPAPGRARRPAGLSAADRLRELVPVLRLAQQPGLSPLIFLNLQPQRYWTGFDVMVNVVGYMPLGVLLVLSLYPLVRGVWAVLVAALSACWCRARWRRCRTTCRAACPRTSTCLTNSAGCLAGACSAAAVRPLLLDQAACSACARRWFAPHASQGLVLLALWPLAQIYPQGYLFGHGQILPLLSEWLSDWLDTDIDLVAMIRGDAGMTVEQYWLSETVITACGMTGAALTLLCLLRRGAPARLLLALMLARLLVKTLASSLLFSPDNAFVWITPGAEGGFLIGLIMLAGLAFAPQVAQRRLAVVTLVLSWSSSTRFRRIRISSPPCRPGCRVNS